MSHGSLHSLWLNGFYDFKALWKGNVSIDCQRDSSQPKGNLPISLSARVFPNKLASQKNLHNWQILTDGRDSRKKSYLYICIPFWVPFLLSLVVNSMKPGPYRELRKMFVARFGKNWRNAGEPNGNVFCLLLNQWSEWATFSLLTLEFLKSQLWS